jgi:hypothetical protein
MLTRVTHPGVTCHSQPAAQQRISKPQAYGESFLTFQAQLHVDVLRTRDDEQFINDLQSLRVRDERKEQ